MRLSVTMVVIYATLYLMQVLNRFNKLNDEEITVCSTKADYSKVSVAKPVNNNRLKATRTYTLTAGIFEWEISSGKTIEAWGYNNQVPGPTIWAKKGDTLQITVKNNLPEPTTIHWHGLRIPSQMDGTEEVQRAILPGEEFTYYFMLPDAGTFWYHPHTNETVQMERGLYGSIVVTDEADPILDTDRMMMIDDMKLDEKNQFSTPSWFYSRWMERHDGRQGETLLVNGKENQEIHLAAGQMERWRFINSANARYFRLHLGKSFKIIGTDGGLLEKPFESREILMAPGERMDIVVGPFETGENFLIESLPYDRGTGAEEKKVFTTVSVGAREESKAILRDSFREIQPITTKDARVTRTIKLHGKRNWKEGVDFTINDQMHLHDQPVVAGELQVWEITNPSMLDHPFHLHGFFFQVLEENGTAPNYLAWKDTYNIPRGTTVKIAWLPDNRTGKWMYHCHILEHAVAGMMAHFEVVEKSNLTAFNTNEKKAQTH